ncbi:hypothetical protein HK102_005936 [Quaeritorhiza haematococci]|nr:hypothetical protein HK102_005936 [Quaeritorhiza haematococci]
MARKKRRSGGFGGRNKDQDDDSAVDYRKGASVKAIQRYEDVGNDSEDEFHEQRGKILLDGDDGYYGRNDDEASEEEVLGLDIPSSDEEGEAEAGEDGEDYDFDEADEEDERLLQKIRANLRRGGAESSDEDESGKKKKKKKKGDEDEDEMGWGRSKKMYYDADDVSDDDEAAKEEEQEALRLQRKRLADMGDQDFLDDSLLLEDSFAKRVSSTQKPQKPTTTTKKSTDTMAMDGLSHVEEDESEDDIENINETDALIDPSLKLANLSPQEIMRLLSTSAPELLDLLEELKSRWEELSVKLGPGLAKNVDHLQQPQPQQKDGGSGFSWLQVFKASEGETPTTNGHVLNKTEKRALEYLQLKFSTCRACRPSYFTP